MMKAPFPYMGGKSTVAPLVWDALGNPAHFIEPFFGSGAVLLNRPVWEDKTETVNDKDGFIANVWRALQFSPDETARWCDWPVNHADLIARKARLIREENYLLENLCKDDKWHDAELAGYWIWAASCWIGSGLTCPGQIPHICNKGVGVHAVGQIPHLGNKGMGVQEPYNENIYKWFRELSERLRRVRVVCGDWERVCGGDWQDSIGDVGIFFDPPYGIEDRDTAIYHHDSTTLAADVMDWCLERGDRDTYRMVLAGYEEHAELLKHGWRAQQWKASGGYSRTGNGPGKENCKRECLYFSPHCLERQLKLL
jgi:DNA adenine methylase